MSLDTFDFPYHSISHNYPETGVRVKFGNSYEFSSAPAAPPQRTFKLNMKGMRYYNNPDGSFSRTMNNGTNILSLEDFYKEHELYKRFLYNHETEGELTVRFKEPLQIPEAIENGGGLFPPFEITLIEQP